jgi:chromate reductase, NAD(P)H dehydrogenase (quinone)
MVEVTLHERPARVIVFAMTKVSILAVSGSLRAASYNTAALRVLAEAAPPEVHVRVFDGIGALPLFNPDLDNAPLPAVAAWRQAIDAADALLIASPEYAHGISGVMKNALDWAVSMPTFPGKPVALLNTSPRAIIAQDALREVLHTMSARLVPEASVAVPLQGSRLDLDGIRARPDLVADLRECAATLAAAVHGQSHQLDG